MMSKIIKNICIDYLNIPIKVKIKLIIITKPNIKKKILQKTGRALQFARPVSLYCVTVKIPPAMQGEGRSLDISNLLC